MAATVSGSKTCNNSPAPQLPASLLTTLMATAPENFTVAQWHQIEDAIERISGGQNPGSTIGSILT